MKERSLTVDEIFDLTTRLIGHCDDQEQLRFIIRFTEARIKALKNRPKKKSSR